MYQQPTNAGVSNYDNGKPVFYQKYPNVVHDEKLFLRRSNELAVNHPIPAYKQLHVATFNRKNISNSRPIF